MGSILGLTGWFVVAVAYFGGALTLPALKLAWAKVKALWRQHFG